MLIYWYLLFLLLCSIIILTDPIKSFNSEKKYCEVNFVERKSKMKYDADYISYVETGESAAVFITRDIVRSINTNGKWIDVISTKGDRNDDEQWDFKEITVELFPRRKQPVFPKNAGVEEKKYITWQTAHEDIAAQRKQGINGLRFMITPKLVNRNKGKYITVERVYNKTFGRYVPKEWKNSSCEIRKCRVPLKPKWEYHSLAIKRL